MRILVLFALVLLMFSCMQEKESGPRAIIEGKISGVPDGENLVRLKRIGLRGPELVDSAELADGAFSLSVPADDGHLFRLEIGKSFLPIFLEEGKHDLSADYNRLYESAKYSNSPLTDQMRTTEGIRLGFEAKAQACQNDFETAMFAGDEKKAAQARAAFEKLQEASRLRIRHFIDSIGPGPVAYLATSMLSADEDYSYLDSLANRFARERPGKIYTQKMLAFMEMPRRLAIGKPAPEFSLPDPAGKMLSLSSFRGNWVLLDFWASWCKPCRAENPFLRAVAEKYKAKGLRIFSVSLDGEREAWMKALVQDQMSWAHVSDLKGWENAASRQYGIQSIPASFLLDPQGRIAAKNLRGNLLLEKLEEVLR
jgi:peroxiredoxin